MARHQAQGWLKKTDLESLVSWGLLKSLSDSEHPVSWACSQTPTCTSPSWDWERPAQGPAAGEGPMLKKACCPRTMTMETAGSMPHTGSRMGPGASLLHKATSQRPRSRGAWCKGMHESAVLFFCQRLQPKNKFSFLPGILVLKLRSVSLRVSGGSQGKPQLPRAWPWWLNFEDEGWAFVVRSQVSL